MTRNFRSHLLPTALCAALVAACGGGGSEGTPPPLDAVAPTATLTAPANLASGLTGMVALAATAADNVAVASVEFQIDGVAIGAADTSAPYAATLDTSLYPAGQHVLRARATRRRGQRLGLVDRAGPVRRQRRRSRAASRATRPGSPA